MKTEVVVLRKRVYALTLDLGIVVLANYFLMAAATRFIQAVFFHFPIRFQLLLLDKMAVMQSISLISLTFAYFSISYYVTNGHTMGKSLLGLRVKSNDGNEITLVQSMLRALAYFTCAMTGSFLFALSYIRKDEKSLADIFSQTGVYAEELFENVGTEFQLTLLHEIESANEEDAQEQKIAKAA